MVLIWMIFNIWVIDQSHLYTRGFQVHKNYWFNKCNLSNCAIHNLSNLSISNFKSKITPTKTARQHKDKLPAPLNKPVTAVQNVQKFKGAGNLSLCCLAVFFWGNFYLKLELLKLLKLWIAQFDKLHLLNQ